VSPTLSLVVIGGGRMGEAIVAGLLAYGALEANRVAVVEPSKERRDVFASHDVRAVADAHEVVPDAEVVMLAVKPQVIDTALAHISADIRPGTLVVSIAAGVSTARLESLVPDGTPVVRVMPNTPAMVGEGMAVVSGGLSATAEHVERVRSLFESVGDAVVLDERYQDAATAISGSGPAYVAIFIDALAAAGVRQGLARDVAQRLAVQTLRGTAALLARSGMHPAELVDAVASPGGTTIAAVEALEAGGLRAAVFDAVAAATARAKELGS
jgi:pyrroline-5-carboxylate reductase